MFHLSLIFNWFKLTLIDSTIMHWAIWKWNPSDTVLFLAEVHFKFLVLRVMSRYVLHRWHFSQHSRILAAWYLVSEVRGRPIKLLPFFLLLREGQIFYRRCVVKLFLCLSYVGKVASFSAFLRVGQNSSLTFRLFCWTYLGYHFLSIPWF